MEEIGTTYTELQPLHCGVFASPLLDKSEIIQIISEENLNIDVTVSERKILFTFEGMDDVLLETLVTKDRPSIDVALLCFSMKNTQTLFDLLSVAHKLRLNSTVPFVMVGVHSDAWTDTEYLESIYQSEILEKADVTNSIVADGPARRSGLTALVEPIPSLVLPYDIEVILQETQSVDCVYLPNFPCHQNELFYDKWQTLLMVNKELQVQPYEAVKLHMARATKPEIMSDFCYFGSTADFFKTINTPLSEDDTYKPTLENEHKAYIQSVMTQIALVGYKRYLEVRAPNISGSSRSHTHLRNEIEKGETIALSPHRLDLRFKGLLHFPPVEKLPPHPLLNEETVNELIQFHQDQIVIKAGAQETRGGANMKNQSLTDIDIAHGSVFAGSTSLRRHSLSRGSVNLSQPIDIETGFSDKADELFPQTSYDFVEEVIAKAFTGIAVDLNEREKALLERKAQSKNIFQRMRIDDELEELEHESERAIVPISQLQNEMPPNLSLLCSELDLSYNAIKALPQKSIAQYSHLVYLNLSHNPICTLTKFVESLGNLKRLDLSHCFFTTFNFNLPKSLVSLNLSHNLLNDETFYNIGNMDEDLTIVINIPTLQELDLSFNEFVGIPTSIVEMTSLLSLSMIGNKLRTFPIVHVGHSGAFFDNLEYLDISGNEFEKIEIPTSMTKLKYINLQYNQLSAIPNLSVFKHTQMTELNFTGNKITRLPSHLSDIAQLTRLTLSHNNLTKLADLIYKLDKLEYLDLSHNDFKYLPAVVQHLKKLHTLILSHNLLELYASSSMHMPESLKVLDLSSNHLLTIPNSIGKLKGLEKLIIRDNFIQTLPVSLKNCHELQEIDISRNPMFTIPEEIDSATLTINIADSPLCSRLDNVTKFSAKWFHKQVERCHIQYGYKSELDSYIVSFKDPNNDLPFPQVCAKLQPVLGDASGSEKTELREELRVRTPTREMQTRRGDQEMQKMGFDGDEDQTLLVREKERQTRVGTRADQSKENDDPTPQLHSESGVPVSNPLETLSSNLPPPPVTSKQARLTEEADEQSALKQRIELERHYRNRRSFPLLRMLGVEINEMKKFSKTQEKSKRNEELERLVEEEKLRREAKINEMNRNRARQKNEMQRQMELEKKKQQESQQRQQADQAKQSAEAERRRWEEEVEKQVQEKTQEIRQQEMDNMNLDDLLFAPATSTTAQQNKYNAMKQKAKLDAEARVKKALQERQAAAAAAAAAANTQNEDGDDESDGEEESDEEEESYDESDEEATE
ncbi:putative Leucine-rich repeat protein soc-2 like protein [Blattamonas nauphoetae]|uniref:Leucine-rich repeat protein soc-2 like protein n=1 Tax=Blattamonas nauphoetae TaxID=2049346 RepID=A0ABQ9YKI0_9EUKA|nr:putative Leucine-rich repeat protein soc-2 like protein [Blattamonas nauphoetae]